MTEAEISEVLVAHLQTMPDLPPVVLVDKSGIWSDQEQKDVVPDEPYILIEEIDTPPQRFGLSSTEIHQGRLVLNVLVKPNANEYFAKPIATAIKAHFPVKFTYSDGNNRVWIEQPVHILAGYNDGTSWRIPVHVRWKAII